MAEALKVIFAGTPAFAATALEALVHSKHRVLAVFTQPDKPAGRGLKLSASPVKTVALTYQLPVYQPKTLKDSTEEELIQSLDADVMVVAAYGCLLPASILNMPRFGCINIHPSLLPRWRGAAPIQRTIYAGDKITGVTIMQMDPGLDTGPILTQQQYILDPQETSATLHDQLAKLGAKAVVEALDLLADNAIKPRPQDDSQATYAHKIFKEEALIDWTRPAIELEHEIRAFNPWPVAYTTWQSADLRIWSAKALSEDHHVSPRTIIRASSDGVDVATGVGVLRLLEVQQPGGKRLSATDFYNARQSKLIAGQHFV